MVVLIGILGGAVGSFLNVVIHRVPRGESVVTPRSRCPGCGVELAARDNVPVVSWLALRGRCRSCGTPISPRYPLVEALTAAVFAGVALARGVDLDLLSQLPFAALLIACAAIDLEHRVIPNRLIVPGALWGVAAGALVQTGELPTLLIAGAGGFTVLLAIALVVPHGMGMGDVKLVGVSGLYLGLSLLPALLVAFLAGSLVGAVIMLREGVAGRKRAVPFGPFVALGGLVGLLWGPELIDVYRDTFLR